MSGCFGLRDDPHSTHFPPDRLVEGHPCVDVFELHRKSLLVPGASARLQTPYGECRIATREGGKIFIDGAGIMVRSHALGMPVFVCPACERDRYRIYRIANAWACRTCHRLDYASRHKCRTVKGYARLLWLRRRLGVEVRPFASLPAVPRRAHRKRELVAEISMLESRLLGHLRHDLNDVLEQRDDERIARRRERKRLL